MNFLALVIISDFDDYFFLTVQREQIAKLIMDGEWTFEAKEETSPNDSGNLLDKLENLGSFEAKEPITITCCLEDIVKT